MGGARWGWCVNGVPGILTVLVAVATGCDAGPKEPQPVASRWAGSVDTLPDGGVLVTSPEEGLWTVPHHLSEVARIGTAMGGGPSAFGQVRGLAVDRLHRVYVLDGLARKVRVFDSSGQFVRSLGREGSGPGEFLAVDGITFQDDSTLWVVDAGNQRYSVFDTSGVYRRTAPRMSLGIRWPWPGDFQGGDLIEERFTSGRMAVLRVDPSQTAVAQETFTHPFHGIRPSEWAPSITVRRGMGFVLRRVPYAAGYVWVLGKRGGVWVGDTRAYDIAHTSLAGDTLMRIVRSVEPVAVSAEERRVGEEQIGREERDRIPSAKPFFRDLLPAEDGGLWVVREGVSDAWMLDIFAPDGRFLGSVDIPVEPHLTRARPIVDGEQIWLEARDSLEVSYVIGYQLVELTSR